MTSTRKMLAAASATMALAHLLRTHPTPTVRVDFADAPDRTAYWPTDNKPKPTKPDTRAKVKAARKQRNRK
jgi:hypothetical protein